MSITYSIRADPVTVYITVCHHIAGAVEVVPVAIDLDPGTLRPPAAYIFYPPAGRITLPGKEVLGIPGTVLIEPVAVYVFRAGHVSVRLEVVPDSVYLLP